MSGDFVTPDVRNGIPLPVPTISQQCAAVILIVLAGGSNVLRDVVRMML